GRTIHPPLPSARPGMRNLPEGERPPSASSSSSLSPAQIATYLDAGVLVVPDVLSPDEVDEARRGLEATLLDECGVDANDLDGTGRGLVDASSTDGAGGVLDVFYPPWKAKVAANQTLFSATRQLWRAAHCHEGERLEDLDEDERFRWHPYGGFDCDRGYMGRKRGKSAALVVSSGEPSRTPPTSGAAAGSRDATSGRNRSGVDDVGRRRRTAENEGAPGGGRLAATSRDRRLERCSGSRPVRRGGAEPSRRHRLPRRADRRDAASLFEKGATLRLASGRFRPVRAVDANPTYGSREICETEGAASNPPSSRTFRVPRATTASRFDPERAPRDPSCARRFRSRSERDRNGGADADASEGGATLEERVAIVERLSRGRFSESDFFGPRDATKDGVSALAVEGATNRGRELARDRGKRLLRPEGWGLGARGRGRDESRSRARARPRRRFSRYIDRIGYRIPTDVAEQIGKQLAKERGEDTPEEGTKKKKKKRARPIQRSLTPHLDCCPETYDDVEGKVKWRPIQCFVSLTDNLEPNTGGFEAVPGFHREFRSWARDGRRRRRRPGSPSRGDGSSATSRPLPCVGEYAHLSPSDDGEILRRTEHVPVRAGSAVFWDNRIPHANAYRNDGREARAVVYCSFLPDIPVNRTFVERQLEDWRAGRVPRLGDRWMRREDEDERDDEGRGDGSGKEASKATISELSELGKRLIGLVEWP
ncbi:hypothetical protein ACHAWF_009582, partial [Thalassiosira exigua]